MVVTATSIDYFMPPYLSTLFTSIILHRTRGSRCRPVSRRLLLPRRAVYVCIVRCCVHCTESKNHEPHSAQQPNETNNIMKEKKNNKIKRATPNSEAAENKSINSETQTKQYITRSRTRVSRMRHTYKRARKRHRRSVYKMA